MSHLIFCFKTNRPGAGGLADGDSGGEPAMENIRCEVSSHLIFQTIVGN